jgi:hypothetical protein
MRLAAPTGSVEDDFRLLIRKDTGHEELVQLRSNRRATFSDQLLHRLASTGHFSEQVVFVVARVPLGFSLCVSMFGLRIFSAALSQLPQSIRNPHAALELILPLIPFCRSDESRQTFEKRSRAEVGLRLQPTCIERESASGPVEVALDSNPKTGYRETF